MPRRGEGPATVSSTPSTSSACRPPVHPNALSECGIESANQENVKGEAVSRFNPENMRGVDSLFYRPPVQQVKVSSQGGHRGEGGVDPLGELEAMLTYVEQVTTALTRRERVAAPPDSLRAVQSSHVASRRGVNTSERDGVTRRPFAVELHDQAGALLGWITKLEYVSLSQGVSLKELERDAEESAASIEAVLDAVEARYCNHDVADVREFFMGSRETVENCRAAAHELVAEARKVLVLRRTVAARDVLRVRELFNEHWGRGREEGPVAVRPFVTWVENSWFPAMERWEGIVAGAQREAEMGDVKGAFARAQRLALKESSMISKIIQPGETLSELLHQYLEGPLAAVEQSLTRKKGCLEALRAALATKDGKKLADCLCAVEELRVAHELSVDDIELVERAREQIVCLQQVESVTAALRLATQAGETVTLFRAIHQANELLLQLGIVGNRVAGEEAVQRSGSVLREMQGLPGGASLAEFVVKRVNPMTINLAHVPSHIWTAETTSVYQTAWQRLAARAMQDLCRLQCESDHGSDTASTCGAHARSNSGFSCGSYGVKGGVSAIASFSRTRTQQTEAANPQHEWSHGPSVQWGEPAPSVRTLVDRVGSVDADEFRLKIHFEGQRRVLRIQGANTCTFEEVYKKVHDLCAQQALPHTRSAGQQLRLRYEDAEGDLISLLTQQDWNEFVSERAPDGLRGAKLDILCEFPSSSSPHLVEPTPRSTTPKDGENSSAVRDSVRPTSSARLAAGNVPVKRLVDSGPAKATKPSRCQSAGIATRRANCVSRFVSTRRVPQDDFHVPKQNPKMVADDVGVTDVGRNSAELGASKGPAAATCDTETAKGDVTVLSASHLQSRAFPVKQTLPSGNPVCVSPKIGRLLPTCGEVKKTRTPPRLVGGDLKVAVRGITAATTPPVEGQADSNEAKKWKEDETALEADAGASVTGQQRTPTCQRKVPCRVAPAVKQSAVKGVVSSHIVNSRTKGATATALPNDAAVVEEKREWSVYHFRPSEIHAVANDREETPPSAGSRVKGTPGNERLSCSSSASVSNSGTVVNNGPKKVEALLRYRQLREDKQKAIRSAVQKRVNK